MDQLPQVTQDWENFMILLPGASGAAVSTANPSSNPGQVVAINGNLPYSNILADGASTTLSHSQNANPAIFETVAELQVNTSTFSAQYGIGGAIFFFILGIMVGIALYVGGASGFSVAAPMSAVANVITAGATKAIRRNTRRYQ